MNRAAIIILVFGATVFLATVAVWVVLPGDRAPTAAEPVAAPDTEEAQRRQRAGQFFGGDPDRDVRGGQEMKPRW